MLLSFSNACFAGPVDNYQKQKQLELRCTWQKGKYQTRGGMDTMDILSTLIDDVKQDLRYCIDNNSGLITSVLRDGIFNSSEGYINRPSKKNNYIWGFDGVRRNTGIQVREWKIEGNKLVLYTCKGNNQSNDFDCLSQTSRNVKAYLIIQPDYYKIGLKKFEEKNYSGAIIDFNKAITNKPNDADLFLMRGVANANLDNFKDAIADYSRAIELKPSYANAFNNRGIIRHSLKNYEGAINDFDKAIKLNSKKDNFFRARALAKIELKDYSGAELDIKKAIKINPTFSTYNYLFFLYDKMKDYEKAISFFNKTIKRNPKDDSSYLFRGGAKMNTKDYSGAISDFRKAISISKNDKISSHSHYGIASIYVEMEDYKSAKIELDRAIDLGLKSEYIFNSLCHTKYYLKDYRSALIDCDKSIKMNPKYHYAYDSRGDVKFALGDKKGACADYKETKKHGYKKEDFYDKKKYKELAEDLERKLDIACN